jgi:hypothetical protein
MPASHRESITRTLRANGKLVTTTRSVSLSERHSELLEQPGENGAVQFPGELSSRDAHDHRAFSAHASAYGE